VSIPFSLISELDSIPLLKYDHIIFDSDGVVLHSNAIKLSAFCEVGKIVAGPSSPSLIRQHIINNKGLARNQILQFILDLGASLAFPCAFDLASIHSIFSDLVYTGMRSCPIDSKIFTLRQLLAKSSWYIVTLGDEAETRRIYRDRKLQDLFDGGIYGSPQTKQRNIELMATRDPSLLRCNTLFIGDSITDAIVAVENNFDFVLLTHWSHCNKAVQFCKDNGLLIYSDLDHLVVSCEL
jgi:phosphoglycolate phosphatase-like HAD superfamily hydrolase